MKERIIYLFSEINSFHINLETELENYRLKYLSKKGIINDLFDEFKNVSNTEKKEFGKLLNELKSKAEAKYKTEAEKFEQGKNKKINDVADISLPGEKDYLGSRHPLQIVQNKIISNFNKIGFTYSEGPEIEDDWHNFSGLNFPENHPARDMQDTFFIDKNNSLRTHTSSVQIRLMEKQKPPIRAIMPGRVYRNEAISARAHCFFHQVEGIYINENVSFADLKQTLFYFVKEMFGKDFEIRFRPSYFPFTEPSAEMDISCMLCKGKGCNVCKHTGWVEILGCGMIDPEVLKLNNIDQEKYSGYAFGMGIERITMLLYDVKDLRVFSNNDVRFLNQFSIVG